MERRKAHRWIPHSRECGARLSGSARALRRSTRTACAGRAIWRLFSLLMRAGTDAGPRLRTRADRGTRRYSELLAHGP